MDRETEKAMKQILRRFGSHKVLKGKGAYISHPSAEREYKRLLRTIMKLVNKSIEKKLPLIKSVYGKEGKYREKLISSNDVTNVKNIEPTVGLITAISEIKTLLTNDIVKYSKIVDVNDSIDRLRDLTMRLTAKEWAKTCKQTLSVDIREDYFNGAFYQNKLDDWTQNNVDLIKSIPYDTIEEMGELIYDGYTSGKSTAQMATEIQELYSLNRNKAEFIARDQIAKLSGIIQKEQQLDAGVKRYVWSTSKDERVRRSHQELEGKICCWDTPPENSDGRACHPGEDYGCRCVAIPLFEKGNLSLPVDGIEKIDM